MSIDIFCIVIKQLTKSRSSLPAARAGNSLFGFSYESFVFDKKDQIALSLYSKGQIALLVKSDSLLSSF